jgi:hypothetical protein
MIAYVTPMGSNAGGQPVNVEAIFVTSASTLTITLQNLQANPTSLIQCPSDLIFTVDSGSTLAGSTLTTSSGQEITVNAGGTFTLGSTVATGWPYDPTAGEVNVLAPGGAGPTHLIIGPPGPGNLYSNANGSIAGNGPHNPFLNQSASFTITGSGITANTTITSATFSFGTTSGVNVQGVPVPEPHSLVLSLTGIGVIGLLMLYRSRHGY